MVPGGEFLSDSPFFGLSLWTEFKLANCASASGWKCLMEPRPSFEVLAISKLPRVINFVSVSSAGLVLAKKSYVH